MSAITIHDSRDVSRAVWTCLVIVVAVPVSIVPLALLYTTEIRLGSVNDLGNGLVGVLCAVLAVQTVRLGTPTATVALAGAGAALLGVGTWLVVSGQSGWVLAGLASSLGVGLVGAWLVAANRAARRTSGLPRRLTVLGEVTGWVMALGVMATPGVLARRDAWEDLTWTDFAGFLGWFGFYLALPVWSALVARSLAAQRLTG